MTKPINAETIRSAMSDYGFAHRDGEKSAQHGIDYYLQDRFKGQEMIDSQARRFTITSVSNAGFNGMQISGICERGLPKPEFFTTYVK